jgi:hypothetical protein
LPLPPGEPPSPPHSPPSGSLVLRFGTAVGLAAAAALACALPAAMRVTSTVGQQDGTGRAWAGLAAAALLPMVITVVALQGAREGLRAFAGPGAELRAYGMALWAGALLILLTALGSILRATTHQHALAGVTFAFGALALAVGLALVCVRLVALMRAASEMVRIGSALALGMLAFAAFGGVGARFLHAVSHDPASAPAGGMIVDILAFGLAALIAARGSLAARRAVALVGPPVAVAVAALGFTALHDPPLRAAIDERAPVFAPVVDAVP